jgi:uncharacterized protein
MDWQCDRGKARSNWRKHGVSFSRIRQFEWATAVEQSDIRFDYGEVRTTAVGFIGDRLHVLVFTRRGGRVHIINLRKANRREMRRYAEE